MFLYFCFPIFIFVSLYQKFAYTVPGCGFTEFILFGIHLSPWVYRVCFLPNVATTVPSFCSVHRTPEKRVICSTVSRMHEALLTLYHSTFFWWAGDSFCPILQFTNVFLCTILLLLSSSLNPESSVSAFSAPKYFFDTSLCLQFHGVT